MDLLKRIEKLRRKLDLEVKDSVFRDTGYNFAAAELRDLLDDMARYLTLPLVVRDLEYPIDHYVKEQMHFVIHSKRKNRTVEQVRAANDDPERK